MAESMARAHNSFYFFLRGEKRRNKKRVNMETEKDYETVELMQKYGGSFVQALAVACTKADQHNFRTIKKAFPQYFAEYDPANWSKNVK
jgi:hypothetical protein